MHIEELLKTLRPLWAAALPGPELEPVYPFGDLPLTEYLRRWAKQEPHRSALIFYGTTITYAQLDEQSDRFAAVLASQGLKRGDRVAVFLSNCPAFIIAFWGILKAGCVHVPVNPTFRELELTHELSDADVSLVVTLTSLLSLVQAVRSKVPQLKCVITTTLQEQLPAQPALPVPPALYDAGQGKQGDLDFYQALQSAAYKPTEQRIGELDELAALNYTGGTTGLPKGCEHTQRDMLYTCACATTFGVGAGNGFTTLTFLPVFWIAGENTSIITPVFSGSTCVMLARWDSGTVLQAIQQYKIQMTVAMVDSWVELMSHPDLAKYDLSSLQNPTGISFVTRLSKEHREQWKAIAGPKSVLREAGYGMTETHTGDTSTRGMQTNDSDLEPGAGTMVGVPMPGTDILIADFETHEFKPIGEPGEILVRTPSATKGYWRKPEATRDLFAHGNWLRTGDSGQLDEQGRVRYLGRRKEMLKVNGMSVFPSELEVLMSSHPDIATVAVIGVLDEKRGQAPIAFVQTKTGSETTASELQAWCAQNMARYKVPTVRLIAALPLAPTGKVDKIALGKIA
jgi:fatty-acyl-CoA synthase/long-chain acyl-CoA synthetase